MKNNEVNLGGVNAAPLNEMKQANSEIEQGNTTVKQPLAHVSYFRTVERFQRRSQCVGEAGGEQITEQVSVYGHLFDTLLLK